MFNKEISDVKKGCGRALSLDLDKGIFSCGKKGYCELCKAKLSTLKSNQAKFDKFVEDLKTEGEITATNPRLFIITWERFKQLKGGKNKR
jgi:hypothetical protein